MAVIRQGLKPRVSDPAAALIAAALKQQTTDVEHGGREADHPGIGDGRGSGGAAFYAYALSSVTSSAPPRPRLK